MGWRTWGLVGIGLVVGRIAVVSSIAWGSDLIALLAGASQTSLVLYVILARHGEMQPSRLRRMALMCIALPVGAVLLGLSLTLELFESQELLAYASVPVVWAGLASAFATAVGRWTLLERAATMRLAVFVMVFSPLCGAVTVLEIWVHSATRVESVAYRVSGGSLVTGLVFSIAALGVTIAGDRLLLGAHNPWKGATPSSLDSSCLSKEHLTGERYLHALSQDRVGWFRGRRACRTPRGRLVR